MPHTQPQPTERPVREALDELQKVRESVQLKLHLASLEARSRWDALEARITELEHSLRLKAQDSATSGALSKIRELTDKVTDFLKHLAGGPTH